MTTIVRRLASRPTLSLAIACAILVVVAAIVIASIRTDRPRTLEGVTAEVNAGLDLIEGELPPAAVVVAEQGSRTEPCPDGTAGRMVYVDRRITLATDFDASSWASGLAREYADKDGWSAKTTTLGGRNHLRITLVNRALLIYTVTAANDGLPATVVLLAGSRCSEE